MRSYHDLPPMYVDVSERGGATMIGFVAPGGAALTVSYQKPHINWRHIDGPLLYFSDGQMHWLTIWERVCCWFGFGNEWKIQRARRPNLEYALARAGNPQLVTDRAAE